MSIEHTTQGLLPRMRLPKSLDTDFWLEGVAIGELRIQFCTECGTLRHPPGPMCPVCNSPSWDFKVASGRGEVYSHCVFRDRSMFAPVVPYTVGLIQLDEGTRIIGDLVDVEPESVHIGLEVELVFRSDPGDDYVLPQWRPRLGGSVIA
jgi:uncharacterized protein